jgi:hypothetical protein
MPDGQFANMPPQQPRGSAPLCFIVDEDFGLRQELSKELRRQAIDVVEFSNSSRLLGMVDDQNINVVGGAPHESMRALLALKECRYGGAVQLFGNCEPKFLESLKVTGLDCGLKMLPPLRMPIKVATLQSIIREQKLGAPAIKRCGTSLKDALARQMVTFLYQPKIDLKAGIVIGAEVVARIADPQFGMITPDQFLKGAEQETLADLTRWAVINALKTSAHFHKLGVALQISINNSAIGSCSSTSAVMPAVRYAGRRLSGSGRQDTRSARVVTRRQDLDPGGQKGFLIAVTPSERAATSGDRAGPDGFVASWYFCDIHPCPA